jgi:hypothetical protein
MTLSLKKSLEISTVNYRHIYHAGNFAGAFKHIVLMLCLKQPAIGPQRLVHTCSWRHQLERPVVDIQPVISGFELKKTAGHGRSFCFMITL